MLIDLNETKKENYETGLAALLVWSFSRRRGSLEHRVERYTVEAWRHLPVFTCPGYIQTKIKKARTLTYKLIAFLEFSMVELVIYREQISKLIIKELWPADTA